MKIEFKSSAVLVSDINRSRNFYEKLLGQEVEMDNGEHIAFKSGFSIWEGKHAYSMIYSDGREYPSDSAPEMFELYFETEDLDAVWGTISGAAVAVLHPVYEHPWGQRGFRITDPDGRIVEIAEPLSAVISRLRSEGMDNAAIAARTSIPEALVAKMSSPRIIAEKLARHPGPRYILRMPEGISRKELLIAIGVTVGLFALLLILQLASSNIV